MPEMAVMSARGECAASMSNAEVVIKTVSTEVCDVSTEVSSADLATAEVSPADVAPADVAPTEVSSADVATTVSSSIVSGGRTGGH